MRRLTDRRHSPTEQTSQAQAGTREEVWKNDPILKIFFQCKYLIPCYWRILLGNLKSNDVFSIFGAAFVCAENLLAGSFPGIRTQGTQHTELSYPCTIHVQVPFLNFCNLTGTDSTWLWHLTSSSRKKKTNCAPRKSWMMRKIDSNWKKTSGWERSHSSKWQFPFSSQITFLTILLFVLMLLFSFFSWICHG